MAPNRSLVTNQSDKWLRFGALKEKIEIFYSMASILMPCSEVDSGYGINYDATKGYFPLILFFRFPMIYHLRGISKFFSEAPIKMALLIPY